MKTEVKQTASWAIERYSYDTETQILTLQMSPMAGKNDGETLRYGGVPEDTFKQFDKAESKGGFFNKYIRNEYNFLGRS